MEDSDKRMMELNECSVNDLIEEFVWYMKIGM